MASRFFTRSAVFGSRFATCGKNVSGGLNGNVFRAAAGVSVPFTRSTFQATAVPASATIFGQPMDVSISSSPYVYANCDRVCTHKV